VPQVLEESARQFGDAPALRRSDGTSLNWNQYRDAAFEIAAGLRSLGLRNGDVVALHSETRLEFYLADLGILANGSIAAALYHNYPVPDLQRSISATGARAVFVENPRMLTALRSGSAFPARVEYWILLTGSAAAAVTLDELRARGRAAIAMDAEPAEIQPSDPAILYLTSGATGESKMVLVTHQAIVANLDMGPEALRLSPDDSMIAFLPSAHIAQRIVVSTDRSAWRWPQRAIDARAKPYRFVCARRYGWPIACCSTKSARVSAAAFAWLPPAPRRWPRIWQISMTPSECRSLKATD
jgi:long-chain acyl-CoA synthetase